MALSATLVRRRNAVALRLVRSTEDGSRARHHARDLAQVIRQAGDLEEVNNALRGHVGYFSFLDMEVCRESAPAVWLHTLDDVQQQRAWKVDVPVELRNRNNQDPYVLRVWCGHGRSFRPRGAERVATILASVLEEWLRRMRAHDPAYEADAAVSLLDYAERGTRTA